MKLTLRKITYLILIIISILAAYYFKALLYPLFGYYDSTSLILCLDNNGNAVDCNPIPLYIPIISFIINLTILASIYEVLRLFIVKIRTYSSAI